MDYEKKYRDTVERAIAWRKKYVNSTISEDGTMIKDFDNIFPELKENEDERIRKCLIKAFGSIGKKEWGGINVKNAIAWLEKQGEQKDVLEDAILDNNEDGLIADTIKAKNEHKPMKTCAEYYNKKSEYKMPELTDFQNLLADILMQREYEGSTETEADVARARLDYELAAIRISEKLLPLAIEHKPAEWSGEDERLLQIIIDILDKEEHKGHLSHTDLIACVRKLKSLRPQSQWKLSDGQMVALKCAITTADEKWVCMNTKDLESLYEDLKKLKD